MANSLEELKTKKICKNPIVYRNLMTFRVSALQLRDGCYIKKIQFSKDNTIHPICLCVWGGRSSNTPVLVIEKKKHKNNPKTFVVTFFVCVCVCWIPIMVDADFERPTERVSIAVGIRPSTIRSLPPPCLSIFPLLLLFCFLFCFFLDSPPPFSLVSKWKTLIRFRMQVKWGLTSLNQRALSTCPCWNVFLGSPHLLLVLFFYLFFVTFIFLSKRTMHSFIHW